MNRMVSGLVVAALAAAGAFYWAQSQAGEAKSSVDTRTSAGDARDRPVLGDRDTGSDSKAAGSTEEMKSETALFSPVEKKNHMRTPDGRWVPALNGAVDPPDLKWTAGRAWSPIQRKIVDNEGTEWYEHADGSYSTNFMLFRSDLGKKEAVTHIVHPEAALPIKDG